MKRSFVLLIGIIVLAQLQFTYAHIDTTALNKKIPIVSDALTHFSSTLSVKDDNKSAPMLYAQLKVKQGILLASQMSGRIQRVDLPEGGYFKSGQVLANFNCAKEKAKLTEARTLFNQQEKIKQQFIAMHSINTLEIDFAHAEWQEAKANVRVAKAILDRCMIYAPVTGKIVKLLVKPRQFVRVGQPLLEIVEERNQEVELLVPAREMQHIFVGKHYKVNQSQIVKPYDIEITHLGGRVDPVSQTVKMYGHVVSKSVMSLPQVDSQVALLSYND